MMIRVPSGAKREPNVIRFKPLGETRVDDVVATLEDLYAETAKPVSARQIGEMAVGCCNALKEKTLTDNRLKSLK